MNCGYSHHLSHCAFSQHSHESSWKCRHILGGRNDIECDDIDITVPAKTPSRLIEIFLSTTSCCAQFCSTPTFLGLLFILQTHPLSSDSTPLYCAEVVAVLKYNLFLSLYLRCDALTKKSVMMVFTSLFKHFR